MLESDIQSYLYEPEYSVEELRRMEEEETATVESQALPACEDSSTELPRARDNCVPIGNRSGGLAVIIQDPKKKLETTTTARGVKQTSDHKVSATATVFCY